MKKFFATLFFATASLSSATAFAGYEICPDGYMCIWGDSSYNGRWQIFQGSVNNIGDFMNDLTTSYWNRTPYTYCAYKDQNFDDFQPYHMGPGSSSAAIDGYENDQWTSFRPC